MFTVRRTQAFSKWLEALKDPETRQRLVVRLRKVMRGNLGDVRRVGPGVFEMREHFGPGWRMYYARRGKTIVIMLGGGDKSSQSADIEKALRIARTLKE